MLKSRGALDDVREPVSTWKGWPEEKAGTLLLLQREGKQRTQNRFGKVGGIAGQKMTSCSS